MGVVTYNIQQQLLGNFMDVSVYIELKLT